LCLSNVIRERFNYSNDSLYGFSQIICLLQLGFPEFAFYPGISEVCRCRLLPVITCGYNNNICRPCNIYESPSVSYYCPWPRSRGVVVVLTESRKCRWSVTTKLVVCVAETHNYYGLNECRIEMRVYEIKGTYNCSNLYTRAIYAPGKLCTWPYNFKFNFLWPCEKIIIIASIIFHYNKI